MYPGVWQGLLPGLLEMQLHCIYFFNGEGASSCVRERVSVLVASGHLLAQVRIYIN